MFGFSRKTANGIQRGDIVVDSDEFAQKRLEMGLPDEPGPSVVIKVKSDGDIMTHLVGRPNTQCVTPASVWKKKTGE